jgi:hypothetical protein
VTLASLSPYLVFAFTGREAALAQLFPKLLLEAFAVLYLILLHASQSGPLTFRHLERFARLRRSLIGQLTSPWSHWLHRTQVSAGGVNSRYRRKAESSSSAVDRSTPGGIGLQYQFLSLPTPQLSFLPTLFFFLLPTNFHCLCFDAVEIV